MEQISDAPTLSHGWASLDLGARIPKSEKACKPKVMKSHCVALQVSQMKLGNALPTLLWIVDLLATAGGKNVRQEQSRSCSNH